MTKEKLLNIMIDTFVCCMNPGYPISIKNIAYLEKETYYQVRKYMKQLEKEYNCLNVGIDIHKKLLDLEEIICKKKIL